MAKLYYSIGEVAEMFKVNASLIRFWEKEFSAIKPKKNKKGNRLFTDKDIDHIRTIYTLVKEKGYTLEGAKAQLKSAKAGPAGNNDIIQKLQDIKGELNKLVEQL